MEMKLAKPKAEKVDEDLKLRERWKREMLKTLENLRREIIQSVYF